jgi:hypothetical protein
MPFQNLHNQSPTFHFLSTSRAKFHDKIKINHTHHTSRFDSLTSVATQFNNNVNTIKNLQNINITNKSIEENLQPQTFCYSYPHLPK